MRRRWNLIVRYRQFVELIKSINRMQDRWAEADQNVKRDLWKDLGRNAENFLWVYPI